MPGENTAARAQLPEYSFGRRLYLARRARGLYIEQAARMAGVSATYWGQLERGYRANPRWSTVVRILAVFPEVNPIT